jgi:hypothetical protein
MEASTVSAFASTCAAAIGAIAAFSSYRSAKASLAALNDTRAQRQLDNARSQLGLIFDVQETTAALNDALTRHGQRSAEVTAARSAVRRAAVLAAVDTPIVRTLLEAEQPLSTAECLELQRELTAESARWHEVVERALTAPQTSLQRRSGQ